MKVYTDDYLIKNIKVVENKEKLVDVKKIVPKVIIGKTNVLRNKNKKILVRENVAKMLKRVIQKLPKNYKLIIYDGYREEKTQKRYFQNYLKKLNGKNPKLNEKKLKKEASKYVADPDSFCPHLTGGAIDVSLAKGKKQIPMGGFIESMGKKISEKIKENRKMLAKLMESAGFVNYPPEWWHWSYGDRYWAAVKKQNSIYKELR